ncbi:MAG: hypothetical protein JW984_13825, partial [Deltaproteobacteria bacterium]|nr:hypothetical protein [Candidatus Zymogenus saltonus]
MKDKIGKSIDAAGNYGNGYKRNCFNRSCGLILIIFAASLIFFSGAAIAQEDETGARPRSIEECKRMALEESPA